MAAGPGIMRTYHDDGADLKAGMRGCFPHYDTSVWRREDDIPGRKRKDWYAASGLGAFRRPEPAPRMCGQMEWPSIVVGQLPTPEAGKAASQRHRPDPTSMTLRLSSA